MTTPRIKHPRRSRIHPYVNSTLRHQLDEYATKHGLTESAVIQEALIKHFEGTGDKKVLFDRLDHVSSTIERTGMDLSAELLELRQHVVAQGQLLALLAPPILSLMQLLPNEKRAGTSAWVQSCVSHLYATLGQRVAKDLSLLHQLPEEVRDALADKVSAKRWKAQPDHDEDTPRAANTDAQPDDEDAPDDVWLDTEPDDDG